MRVEDGLGFGLGAQPVQALHVGIGGRVGSGGEKRLSLAGTGFIQVAEWGSGVRRQAKGG